MKHRFWWGAAARGNGESAVQVCRCPATVKEAQRLPVRMPADRPNNVPICEVRMMVQGFSDGLFEQGWRSLAHSRFLPFSLLVLGTVSSVVYAHSPQVAFAALSGATLSRRRAIAIPLLVWLVNQIIGFGWRGYPLTATAFTWGALMGIGTLLVAGFASWRPRFSQTGWAGHFLWMAIALLGGFVLYQGLIALAYPLLADGHRMGWDVISKLLLKQLVWGGAIALGHTLLLGRSVSNQQRMTPSA